jgi:multidrug efflux pump subunit AcrB
MNLTHFFIERPRFAVVLNIFIALAGLAFMVVLPIAQYPSIVPPNIDITTIYPGASAETIAKSVATPIEQAVNGVENMDYISSQSTSNGLITITVIFKIGTDINTALMLTQNRVQDTLSGCPRTSSCRACRSRRPSQPCSLACIPIPRTGPAAPNTSPTI